MLRVEAVQSGQMVPVPKAWTFDSSEADPAEHAELNRLLENSDFLQAPEPSPAPGADRGTLSILVETDKGSRRLTLPLGQVPAAFSALTRFIESRLQWRPRKP
jgi:hypothetical protein